MYMHFVYKTFIFGKNQFDTFTVTALRAVIYNYSSSMLSTEFHKSYDLRAVQNEELHKSVMFFSYHLFYVQRMCILKYFSNNCCPYLMIYQYYDFQHK